MHSQQFRRAVAGLCLALALPGWAAESCPLAPARIGSESAAVARAAKAIEVYRIGKLKAECMALAANRQKGGYLIDVREIHNEACGGDPMTEPRAFSIDVASNGAMKSDVYDHVSYQPLRCPKA